MNTDEVYLEAATIWHRFGLDIIPIRPNSKVTTVKWNSWQEDLSLGSITIHWTMNPDHEVGFIVGKRIIVFDADTPEAVAELTRLEREHGVVPNLVVKTKKGEHHYFILAEGAYAKTSGHGSERSDQKIDVKTGKTMVVLPPSVGKEILTCEAKHVDDLVEVDQKFIDAIFEHKGLPVPRPIPDVPRPKSLPLGKSFENLKALLEHINPDKPYNEWFMVGCAIYNETHGSEDGYHLFDAWSRKGQKYKSPDEARMKWASFNHEHPNPITISTLCRMVNEDGGDAADRAREWPIRGGRAIFNKERPPQGRTSFCNLLCAWGGSTRIWQVSYF